MAPLTILQYSPIGNDRREGLLPRITAPNDSTTSFRSETDHIHESALYK